MKQLLIITGPQGSGNHVFSKILSLHESVYGWNSLNETYWEGHHDEPFSSMWQNPDESHAFDWEQSDYYITSISCPYIKNKVPHIPNYSEFIRNVSRHCEVSIAVIGRDQNILTQQQSRLRGDPTTHVMLSEVDKLNKDNNLHFLSQELLYLYKHNYLEELNRQLPIPVEYESPDISDILEVDANEKYIQFIDTHWLDKEVHRVIKDS
jgi:hypothetical protein